MKKVGFASGEVSLLRRVLAFLDTDVDGWNARTAEHAVWTKVDRKAAARILEKLKKAEQSNDPAVNAPAIEDALITYSHGKVVPLALPNWQRYARQGADIGVTIQDAQTVGTWMYRQNWLALGSQTLDGVFRNWSGWLGKARAAEQGQQKPQAGLNGQPGNLGQDVGAQRVGTPTGRPASGLGRKGT